VDSLHPVEDFALTAWAYLDAIPGAKPVFTNDGAIQIFFDNADFVLRLVPRGDEGYEVYGTVTVREPAPGLGTWWTDWRASYPGRTSGTALAEDILTAHSQICRMLDDCPRLVPAYPTERPPHSPTPRGHKVG
jgi:hypothetical protein